MSPHIFSTMLKRSDVSTEFIQDRENHIRLFSMDNPSAIAKNYPDE